MPEKAVIAKLAWSAVILPLASFLLLMALPLTLREDGPNALPALLVFSALGGMAISIPFGAWIAWRGRQLRIGIAGAGLGLALTTFTLFAFHQIRIKAEADQKSLEARQSPDSQSLPPR